MKKSKKIDAITSSRLTTVKDLIEHLKTLPQDAFIGRVGHFGEFNEMTKYDFFEAKSYITASGSWRDENRENITVVNIISPDIGEEPD